MKPEDMNTTQDALRWALRRIETAGLGCGDYFERAEALLNPGPAAPTQVYCYWPDGRREYLELGHWPRRDELPATAVRFDMAVPDPAALVQEYEQDCPRCGGSGADEWGDCVRPCPECNVVTWP